MYASVLSTKAYTKRRRSLAIAHKHIEDLIEKWYQSRHLNPGKTCLEFAWPMTARLHSKLHMAPETYQKKKRKLCSTFSVIIFKCICNLPTYKRSRLRLWQPASCGNRRFCCTWRKSPGTLSASLPSSKQYDARRKTRWSGASTLGCFTPQCQQALRRSAMMSGPSRAVPSTAWDLVCACPWGHLWRWQAEWHSAWHWPPSAAREVQEAGDLPYRLEANSTWCLLSGHWSQRRATYR